MPLSCRKCGKSFTGLFSQSGLLAKATTRAFEERGIDVSDICFECCKAMQEKQIVERNTVFFRDDSNTIAVRFIKYCGGWEPVPDYRLG